MALAQIIFVLFVSSLLALADESCEPNECLSQWGYCGTTSAYCGEGCKGGPCTGSSPKPAPRTPSPTPKPVAPTPKPVAPTPKPVAPTPKPVSQPVPAPKSSPKPVSQPVAAPTSTGTSGCGDWKTGTMSGYDNLDGSDDMHPGCLADYCGTTDGFLNAVPVVSILARDFPSYKYHFVEINYKGKVGTVQVWDECVNDDCPNGEKDCCTANARAFGGDFLLDLIVMVLNLSLVSATMRS